MEKNNIGSKEDCELLINSINSLGFSRKDIAEYLGYEGGDATINSNLSRASKAPNKSFYIKLQKALKHFKASAEVFPVVNTEEELLNTATLKMLYKHVAKITSSLEKKDISKVMDEMDADTKIVMRELYQNLK